MYYETFMLASTQATNDEILALEKHLDKVINNAKGKLVLFDKWGKYKLAYPVKKNVYGLYILCRYELPEEVIKDFSKELSLLFKIKYNDIIMRHVTINLPEAPSTIYLKPEPIVSRKAGSLDSFLKENKIEGFIDKEKPKNNISEQETAKKDSDKKDSDIEKEEKTEEIVEEKAEKTVEEKN